MDPFSAILGALLAGATAATSRVGGKAVEDAYEGLKQVLRDGYRFVSTTLLDNKPDDKGYQAAVESELKQHPEIAEDERVQEATLALQNTLIAIPPADAGRLNIDLERVRVGKDVIVSYAANVKIKRSEIIGSVIASGQGNSSGK